MNREDRKGKGIELGTNRKGRKDAKGISLNRKGRKEREDSGIELGTNRKGRKDAKGISLNRKGRKEREDSGIESGINREGHNEHTALNGKGPGGTQPGTVIMRALPV